MVVDGNKKNMLSTEIFLWYLCNYKCNFCFEFNNRLQKWYWKEKILELIKKSYKNWAKKVIFSWWEPTLDINLLFYISYSKKLWFREIWIHTNWTKLDNNDFLLNLYKNWLTGVIISIHWLYWICDLITWKKWSFEVINRALINLWKIKNIDNNFKIDTNTVICKQNKKILYKLFLYLLKFPITKRLFSFPNSTEFIKWWENIKERMNQFMIKYDEVKQELKLINLYKNKFKINDLMLEGIPFCMVEKELYWFLLWWKKQWEKMLFSSNLYDWVNDKDFSYLKYEKCKKCNYNYICYWFSKDYIAFYWKPKNLLI